MDNDCHTEPAAAAVSGAGAVATGDPAAVCTPTASLHDDHCACYAALSSHDARFDGRFFVGVTSTGIYCRPVCRAKLPREENCRFFSSAAAAEAAGFRPCMRCRPELAPGLAAVDAQGSLARRAATLIDEGLTTVSLPRLAAAVGTSERHLRRVFEAEFGVSPVQYLQTRRLLLAKSLLTDTRLPVTQVAFAAGFKSVRRFNELFRERYRLQPRDLRKSVRTSLPQGPGITVQLDYRPPFDGQALLGFLAGRTIAGVEAVVDGTYCRSVRITAEEGLEEDAPPTGGAGAVMNTAAGLGAAPAPAPAGHASGSPAAAAATSAATGARGVADGPREYCGWLSVAAAKGKHALALTLSESLLPVLPRVIARVRLLFDLNADPAAIGAVLQTMDDFRPGLYRPGTRLPGSFDSWEMAVRAVLGQQVTVKAAQTLARRLSERFGTPIETPFADVCRLFPTAAELLALPGRIEDNLGSLGVTGARSRCIATLARALQDDPQLLSPLGDAPEQMRRLLALPGFGPWTVNYLAMRALAWPDAFPHSDFGVKKALAPLTEKEILTLAERWRPWRSYATIELWNSLAATPAATVAPNPAVVSDASQDNAPPEAPAAPLPAAARRTKPPAPPDAHQAARNRPARRPPQQKR